MRLTIYLPRDAEVALDRLVRAHGGTRSQVLADLLRQADRDSGAIQAIDARLDRIEALLRQEAVAASAAPTPAPVQGETDADRSMALLRAWGARGNADDEDTEEA